MIQDHSRVLPEFVAYMMKFLTPRLEALATGGTFKEFSKSALSSIEIPIPPIDAQRQIVLDIEGHQRRIEELKQEISEREQDIKLSINKIWVG